MITHAHISDLRNQPTNLCAIMTTNNNNSISGVGSGGAVVENKDNDNEKDNPFADYMWMGEEDEFNKQARQNITPKNQL